MLSEDTAFLDKHIGDSFCHKTVLITGASGFFGTWMTRALSGKCNLVLAGRDNLDATLRGNCYDMIFHFAPTPIEPVIECAWRSDATVLYASSGAVYGGAKQQVRESDPTWAKTDYGKEKLRCEFLLKESGLDYRICRLFTFCGTELRDYFAITAFVNAVKEHRPMKIMGNGSTVRSYLYAADAIVWMCKIMTNGYGIYNVGSERSISIAELAGEVRKFGLPDQLIEYDPRPFESPAPYYLPSCRKARDELELYQWHTLEYGIERMME